MEDIEIYDARFYNLGGANYLEHMRNFHKYFNDLKKSKIDTRALINQLEPHNLQEDIFHVKLLLEFGSDEDLLKTFLKCNVILNKLLVRNTKFVDIFIKKQGNYFTDQICMNISYAIKLKLINKLSYAIKDDKIGGSYFNAIRGKYGLKMATPLLIACSGQHIKHIFEETDVRLNNRQLIYLHKKHPECVQLYFSNYKNFNNYNILAQYLCFHDLQLFHSLLEYGTPKIGRRAFNNFAKKDKNDIIENPMKFQLPLRHDLMYKNLSKREFKLYFTNLLQHNFALNGDIIKCVSLAPPNLRGELFFTSYKDKYGFDVWSQTEEMPVDILKMLSLEDRLKFDLGDKYIEMQDSAIAIPKLKAKIGTTRACAERIKLLEKLVITCKVNNDLLGLLEVLKYFYDKHKNETQLRREEFLHCVSDNFDLEKLSAGHWEYLRNLLLLFDINGQDFYRLNSYWEKMIYYKIRNNLDYCDDLKYYFDSKDKYWIAMLPKYPTHEKKCLLQLPNHITNMYKEEDDIKRGKLSFFDAIEHYNGRNPKDQISYYDYPDYLRILINALRTNNCCYGVSLKQFIRYKTENKNLYEEVVNSIKICYNFDSDSSIWFLHRKPQQYAKHYCRKIFESKHHELLKVIFYNISKMHYLDVYEEFKTYALQILENQHDDLEIYNALNFLSFVRDFDYLKGIEKYLPKLDCKIDVQDENFKGMLGIQKGITKQFNNFPLPLQNIQSVLQFCNGDYLQFGLKPLYYTLYNIPEKYLNEYFAILLTKQVSVRKHTVFLISQLCNTTDFTNFLKLGMEKENNSSVKQAIVITTLQKFSQDQCNDYWVLFKSYLEGIQEDDLEIIDYLLAYKVPRRHAGDFIKLLWERLKLYGKKFEHKVLQKITFNTFNALPDDFCDELIKGLHLIDLNLSEMEYLKLITNYLICCDEKLNHRVSVLFESLANQNNYKAYVILNHLCVDLCTADDKLKAIGVITKLIENMNVPFNSLYFKLLFAITKCLLEVKQNKKNENEELATWIHRQFSEIINLHHKDILGFYTNFILHFLHAYFKSSHREHEISSSMLQIVEGLLKLDDTEETMLLCLQLLPQTTFKHVEWKQKHEAVIQKIKRKRSEIVDIFLFEYLRVVDFI